MPLKEWAEFLGVKYGTLWQRLKDGMPLESALVAKIARKPKPRDPDKTIVKMCLHCAAEFTIPKSRDWREHCCSSSCKAAYAKAQSNALRLSRTRACKQCSSEFVAKKSQIDEGGGNYCSMTCHHAAFGMSRLLAPEVQSKAVARMRELRQAGKVRYLRGQFSPTWKGGKEASRKRNAHKMAARNRAYRKANPEKVREWSAKRASLKTGRLPRGTVARLLKAQRGCCPICRQALKGKYHLDHIIPLARGGKHVPWNVQLLCIPCNLRKSAKDPITYMQERGYLL